MKKSGKTGCTVQNEPVINIENKNTMVLKIMIRSECWRWILTDLGGACTTSGMAFKMQGGDSVIGAGLFVDNEIGSVHLRVSEKKLCIVGSNLVVEYMRQGLTREIMRRLLRYQETLQKQKASR